MALRLSRAEPEATRGTERLPLPPANGSMELAMATAAKTVYSHVTKQPGVRGGRPCIDDTRIAVVDIVAMLKQGKSAEQMLLAEYPPSTSPRFTRRSPTTTRTRTRSKLSSPRTTAGKSEHERRKAEYLRTAKQWRAVSLLWTDADIHGPVVDALIDAG